LKHDVIIIGGSLAGAACARELNRCGVDVIALERDAFPRPKVCGGFLSPNAVESLDQLQLLDSVRSAGAVEVTSVRLRAGDLEIQAPLSRPALGISRSILDQLLAQGAPVRQSINVLNVVRGEDGFQITTDAEEMRTRILVDAAGKLSRFTRRHAVAEFGVQHFENQSRGRVLDFWLFDDGYGGAVSVEGGRSNFCFLIRRHVLKNYLNKPDYLCTGPLAYDREPGDVIAIGDAAGMIDPFCGEGMHQALDSGITAAQAIIRGLSNSRTYPEIQQEYYLEWRRRWSGKRLLAKALRPAVRHPGWIASGLRWNPGWLLDRLWDRILR